MDIGCFQHLPEFVEFEYTKQTAVTPIQNLSRHASTGSLPANVQH